MANHHPKLAALAKAISYRKGDLVSLERRESELLRALEEVRREKSEVQQAVQRLSVLIEEFELNPQDIRGIRATPRKEGSIHGLFRNTLIKVLKAGGPITTAELLHKLQELDDSRINLRDGMHKVARELRKMSEYGVVIRYDFGGAGQPATWLWIGDATDPESS
ncbi:hypothetical protein [Aquipseudomonas campi]